MHVSGKSKAETHYGMALCASALQKWIVYVTQCKLENQSSDHLLPVAQEHYNLKLKQYSLLAWNELYQNCVLPKVWFSVYSNKHSAISPPFHFLEVV